MSNKILSQDEIDALLKGVQSGSVDTGAQSAEESGVKTYDLTNQERIIRGRMPGLEIANERFARFFRNSISTIIQKFVDVNIHGVEMMKFSEFMKTLPLPSSINIFKMEPLRGFSLFVLGAPAVFAFVEYFFGATTARNTKSEGRYFTPIEQRIIKKVVSMVLKDLAMAWKGIVSVEPEHVGSEMNPQFVTIVTPTEVIIKVEVHLEVEDFTGKMYFCIPYSVIEPIKEKLYSGIQAEQAEIDQHSVSRLGGILKLSTVEVAVEMGTTELMIEEILDLKKGDVIPLNKSINEDLTLTVEGIPKFKCVAGQLKGNLAVKITKEYV
ncbi:flagellar motor switch protein FliM [Candidatus Magnetominusculus xianensis]|uniref:Flagellar motor switch protein FliM n=1 Tax=Candidatus Magnetominusculus xianensis TaxID=1748249 RepID=A0ABR5SFP9_9BACT|nr:flagellar motor switch protein FliM [Candidatus Magnetominusculus xianensis]KWT84093.1 flagellar motor switch protein FliM [Candidatus Magnetominusculus xianensis]MBF0402386.1 flagellar motor switch protein FliM [Nitrospirota bacterium]